MTSLSQPADLTLVRKATALILNACAVTTSADLTEALYWSAVTDAALALHADLAKLPGDPEIPEIPEIPEPPENPENPESPPDLPALCAAIQTGLRSYLSVVAPGAHAFRAAVATRSAQRLVDAAAGQ